MNVAILIGFIVSAALITGGAVLLTVSIVRTVKKKKSIGGIIGGSVMLLLGVLIVCVIAGVFSFLNTLRRNASGSKTDLTDTFKVAEYETIYGYIFNIDKLAKKGYSGDPVDYSEAYDVMLLYSNMKNTRTDDSYTEVVTYGDIEVVRFKTITSSPGADYHIYFECISEAPDEDYIGIQYIRVERHDTVFVNKEVEILNELGTKPVI